MDFAKFDARKASAAGAWLHLCHPATGAKLYDDNDTSKPCRIKVQGAESPDAHASIRRAQKAMAKAVEDKDTDAVREQSVAMAKSLVLDFENMHRDGRPMTLDDVDWLLNLQIPNGQSGERAFVEQIVDFAFKRASFLGNAQQS